MVAVLAWTLNISRSRSTASTVELFVGIAPFIAVVKLSAARIKASAGVNDGIVMYLCLKNTVPQFLMDLVSLMYML